MRSRYWENEVEILENEVRVLENEVMQNEAMW
jgi:hypothetical protein